MTPSQPKETTMDPRKRSLIKVALPPGFDEPGAFDQTERLVADLMGRKPERRFAYIQESARFAMENWTCEEGAGTC
ncbi:MAG: hypothetical protein JNK11_12680 [Alphaproteobacteria bacterium]|nr:hypothetical protein [Alphaproteobacteria bacterium]